MAQREVIWTDEAKFDVRNILDYWIERNSSHTYAEKLLDEFDEMGKQTGNILQLERPQRLRMCDTRLFEPTLSPTKYLRTPFTSSLFGMKDATPKHDLSEFGK